MRPCETSGVRASLRHGKNGLRSVHRITERSSYLKSSTEFISQPSRISAPFFFFLHFILSPKWDDSHVGIILTLTTGSLGRLGMQGLKKGHNEPVVLPGGEKKWKFRCSWFDKTFPTFLLPFPGTLQTECWRAEHRGEQKDEGIHVATSVAFLIFQFIFTSPSFVRPLSLSTVEKCVCTFTHIYFIFIAEGRDCSCSVCIYTKLFDPCFSVDVCCISSSFLFIPSLFVCCTCSIFKLTWCLYVP